MTPFSLKNTALVASLLTVSVGISAFAAPVKTECTTDPLFATNACNVCYTDTQKPTKTPTGWTAELSSVVIPWDHSGIDLQEVISESAQQLPEMIPSANVTITPTEADKIWEFGTDIVWYEVGSDREFFIEKWEKKGLYTLKTGVKLALSGKWAKDTVLIKTPLLYEEYNKDLNQSDSGKNRNICVLNTFYTGTISTPVVTPPPVVTETPPVVVPPLDAAGPGMEEESDEEEVTPEITPEQTETKAGPGMWIFLLFAFVFSSAWTAWRKQKI
jgi:hypothetical protein